MFSKSDKPVTSKEPPPPQPKVSAEGAPSIISTNLHVVGNLKTEGELQIDGLVDGDVAVKSLTVGGSATINGEIEADTVVVRGSVNGRIKARSVELTKSAKVIGDIIHERLSVEAGAHLEGRCQRGDHAPRAAAGTVENKRDKAGQEAGTGVGAG